VGFRVFRELNTWQGAAQKDWAWQRTETPINEIHYRWNRLEVLTNQTKRERKGKKKNLGKK